MDETAINYSARKMAHVLEKIRKFITPR